MIPRIRGRVGQADSEMCNGKWFFEIYVDLLGEAGGPGVSEPAGTFGPYDSKEEAQIELRRACKIACDAAEEIIDGKPSGKYIDMKTNLTRRWDQADEN